MQGESVRGVGRSTVHVHGLGGGKSAAGLFKKIDYVENMMVNNLITE